MRFRIFLLLLLANTDAPSVYCQHAVEAPPFRPDQTELPIAAPEGAIPLFDGSADHAFVSMAGGHVDWLVENGNLIAKHNAKRNNHLCSNVHFRDADIHVEFKLPDQKDANSGIYLHGNYEVQIFNSFGDLKLTQESMGAIYGFAPPRVNASREVGQWQVFDIRYRAPRRDDAGNLAKNGSITCWLNGQRVQDETQLGEPRSNWHPFRYGNTPYLDEIYAQQKRTSVGPLFLQDHDHSVRFRNIWIQPLDSQTRTHE